MADDFIISDKKLFVDIADMVRDSSGGGKNY